MEVLENRKCGFPHCSLAPSLSLLVSCASLTHVALLFFMTNFALLAGTVGQRTRKYTGLCQSLVPGFSPLVSLTMESHRSPLSNHVYYRDDDNFVSLSDIVPWK